jgi:hypothetical protein
MGEFYPENYFRLIVSFGRVHKKGKIVPSYCFTALR